MPFCAAVLLLSLQHVKLFFMAISSSFMPMRHSSNPAVRSAPVRLLLMIFFAAASLKPRTLTRLCMSRICSMSFSEYWRTLPGPLVLGFRYGNSCSQYRRVLSFSPNIRATSLME